MTTQSTTRPIASPNVADVKEDRYAVAAQDADLMPDFLTLCSFGGRLSGSGQEHAAAKWLIERLRAIGPDVTHRFVDYDGWRLNASSLTLMGETPAHNERLQCYPLLRSSSTAEAGLTTEVIDLGPGRPEDFARHKNDIRGKAVLVRHEFPFSTTHVHRRVKYDLAVEHGATAFLIANPSPGAGVLSGSSGRAVGAPGIPAAYIDDASAQAIRRASAHGPATVVLTIIGEEIADAKADVCTLDIPGGSDDIVVLSAHIDGHDLGQSALDNATGLATALAAARFIAPQVSAQTASLRICFFAAEEWALAGSRDYVANLPAEEKARIRVNVNLDTVGGDDSLTALISDYPQLAPYVEQAAVDADVPVGTHLPIMPNSDHANFARAGIPALRLVAGFERPESNVRHILSAQDVPDIVAESELRQALKVTCALVWNALNLSDSARKSLADR